MNGHSDDDEIDIIDETQINDFDAVIGHIEDIIISSNFEDIQVSFLERYCHHFDESEENKFIYTEIFQEYTDVIENFINQELLEVLPEFSMESFLCDLRTQRNNLHGEIFELLHSLSDFQTFKELILDFKNVKDGKVVDLSSSMNIINLTV